MQQLLRTYTVLSETNQILMRGGDQTALLAAACQIAVARGRFIAAWIGLHDDVEGHIVVAAHAGASTETMEIIQSMLKGEQEGCFFTHAAFEDGEHGVCNDLYEDPRAEAVREVSMSRGYRSVASLPLRRNGVIVGVFNLYAPTPGFFDEHELKVLDELAVDISFALELTQTQIERTAATQALHNSEAQLSNALSMASMGHWEYDVVRDVFIFNDHFYRMMRTSVEREGGYEMRLDHYASRFLPPDEMGRVASESQRAMETTDPDYIRDIEHRVMFGDGKSGHLFVRIFVERDETGRVIKTRGVSQDITKRKEAEAKIDEVSRRFLAVVEHSADGIGFFDEDRNVTYISPSITTIEGRLPTEFITRGFSRDIHPEDLSAFDHSWHEMVRQPGQPTNFSVRRQHKSGRWLWIEGVATNLLEDAGIRAVVLNYRDVTERRQLEEQYLQSQKMEAIGQLAGGVAHDFNNILAAIMMQVDLADAEVSTPEEMAESLSDIKEAATRAAELTRQLLAFGRRQAMQATDVELNETFNGMSQMLTRTLSEDVNLRLELHPSELWVRGDASMLGQLLLNLAINARDAMPDGGDLVIATDSRFVATAESSGLFEIEPGHYAVITVTDTGCGISTQDKTHVFEPFFTTKQADKGSGLGLATVFGIVKQHDGVIDLTSDLDRGTTFTIYLPLLQEPRATTPAASAPPQSLRGDELILLVEDENHVRAVTRKVLESYGYRVIEARSGRDALFMWEQAQVTPDLLLTDIVMPGGLSGWDLADQLLALKPELKVLFTSGYNPEVANNDFSLKPGQRFIAKPAEAETVVRTVRQLLA